MPVVNPGIRRFSNIRGGIPIANRAAHFDAWSGITSSGGFASAWADQSGNSRNLLQATGANQPIHLDYSGTKYGWFPGVAGNYFSTPDAAANRITGDIDIRWYGALADWTPSASNVLLAKDNGASQRSYIFYLRSDGKLNFTYTSDGSTVVGRDVASSVATGIADGATYGVRVTLATATGKVNFYTSPDGITWTPLGTEKSTTASSIFAGSAQVEVGSYALGAFPVAGRCYSAQIYNGIGGTLAVDFDPSRWTSGTTFTASTGETWTINSTGSKPAQIVDRPSLLGDGSAHYMATAAFTLNQPTTLYLVGRQITWSSGDVLVDGATANSGALVQTTGTPQINLNAGSSVAGNTEMTLATRKVVCCVFNGANSSLQVTSGAATTGNAGAGNMGGITLFAAPTPANYSNWQVNELLAYSVAHDATTRANIIRALMAKHGVA